MRDHVHIICPEDPAWDRWLSPVSHDLYHSAAYHAFSQRDGQGAAKLAVYGSPDRFFAWPYLLNRIPENEARSSPALFDVTSVYGYPGPLSNVGAAEDGFLKDAWRAILEHWASERVVSVFSRFHPVLANHRLLESSLKPEAGMMAGLGLRAEGRTVSIDLMRAECGAETAPPLAWPKHIRYDIRRARALGISVETNCSWNSLEDFVRLYHLTMDRNRAAPSYYFGVNYFQELRRALGGHIFLHVARLEQKIIAAIVTSEYNGIAQYLFSGDDGQLREASPPRVLLTEIAGWARTRGCHTFHLGGGRGARDRDSLFFFKSRFSPRRHEFHTGRWILDPSAYEMLCNRRRAGAQDTTGFFPAYRAPQAVGSRQRTPVASAV